MKYTKLSVKNKAYDMENLMQFIKEKAPVDWRLPDDLYTFVLERQSMLISIRNVHIEPTLIGHEHVFFEWIVTDADGEDDWCLEYAMDGDRFIEVY